MKQNGYVKAVKAAFPYTIPVLTGYLFIGIAFGVMYQEKGYNFLWANPDEYLGVRRKRTVSGG